MRQERLFIAVYMMTNAERGTLYVGVTSNLYSRVLQHRAGEIPGFTQKHGLHQLVWFEQFECITDAIQREKALKRYRREWKVNLIERDNPRWEDLAPSLGL